MTAMQIAERSLAETLALQYLEAVENDGSAVLWTTSGEGGADLMVEPVAGSGLPWRASIAAPGRGVSCQALDPVAALVDCVTMYTEMV